MRPIIKTGLKPLIRSTTTLRSLSFFPSKKVHFQNMSQNQTMNTTDYKFDWRALAWGDYNNSTQNDSEYKCLAINKFIPNLKEK